MKYLMILAMNKCRNALLFCCLSLLFIIKVTAQNIPDPLSPPRLVNDYGHYLRNAPALEAKLLAYNLETSNQIAVVLMATTDGDDVSDFAIKLFNKWGIGSNAEKDNGVLIFLAVEDRKLFIVTGRGVEDVLPDITCKHIVEDDMKPHLKESDYDGAVLAAVEKIQGYLTGKFTEVSTQQPKQFSPKILFILALIFFIVVVFIMPKFGSSTISRGGYNSGWGGGGWGGGGRSSGGGGFGGFGGGSSGGGGAGGGW